MTATITTIQANLLSAPKHQVVAHCISSDCALGAGVAKVLANAYPELREVCQKRTQLGSRGVTFYQSPQGRIIANLVTKDRYFHKPTLADFERVMRHFADICARKGARHIAMPYHIGCGLDRLPWDKVQTIIQDAFVDGTQVTFYRI